jgi:hypothetical protein
MTASVVENIHIGELPGPRFDTGELEKFLENLS